MKRKSYKLLSLVITAVLLVAMCGGGQALAGAQPIKLRYASVYTADSHYGRAIERFKEIVERESGGALFIDTFHDALLGPESEMIQSQKDGGIEIAFSAASGIGLYVPSTLILESFFAYEKLDEVRNHFESLREELDAAYQAEGFKLIGGFYDGYRNILSKNKPIYNLDDVKRLKMRSPTNPMYSGCIEALGAQAIAMPLGDVYTSLQTGAIEACEGTLDTIYNQKFYEQAKYLIWDSHTWVPMSVTFNLASWNSLSGEHQKIILDAAAKATEYQVELFNAQCDRQLEEMKATGVTVCEVTDREKWVEAVAPVLEKLANQYGELGIKIYESQKALQHK